MKSRQSIQSKASLYPWDDQEIKPIVKFGVFLAVFLLILLGTGFVGGFIASIAELGSVAQGDLPRRLLGLLLFLIFGAATIFGVVKLWPLLSIPTPVVNKTPGIDPAKAGEAFSANYSHYYRMQSFSGAGTVTFAEDSLRLGGTLEPSAIFQLGVIVVVTVAPLVLFGCGLGLLPALVLAYFLGRKEKVLSIPYSAINEVTVTGKTVVISHSGDIPKTVKFRVAGVDGERLYRELYTHLPSAVSAHAVQLRQLFGDPGQTVGMIIENQS